MNITVSRFEKIILTLSFPCHNGGVCSRNAGLMHNVLVAPYLLNVFDHISILSIILLLLVSAVLFCFSLHVLTWRQLPLIGGSSWALLSICIVICCSIHIFGLICMYRFAYKQSDFFLDYYFLYIVLVHTLYRRWAQRLRVHLEWCVQTKTK